MSKQFQLYKVTHRDSGKAYVGITTQSLARRWRHHINIARNKPSCRGLAGAIRKYGADAFDFHFIASSWSCDDMRATEQILIAQEGTLVPYGYNLNEGGGGLFNPSAEVRHRMSMAARSRVMAASTKLRISAAKKGETKSKETRERISAAKKGVVMSPEWRAKLAAAKVGKKRLPEVHAHIVASQTGLKRSIETRHRMSLAQFSRNAALKAAYQEQSA